jgi:hypothetical protein
MKEEKDKWDLRHPKLSSFLFAAMLIAFFGVMIYLHMKT